MNRLGNAVIVENNIQKVKTHSVSIFLEPWSLIMNDLSLGKDPKGK